MCRPQEEERCVRGGCHALNPKGEHREEGTDMSLAPLGYRQEQRFQRHLRSDAETTGLPIMIPVRSGSTGLQFQ